MNDLIMTDDDIHGGFRFVRFLALTLRELCLGGCYLLLQGHGDTRTFWTPPLISSVSGSTCAQTPTKRSCAQRGHILEFE